MTIFEHFTNEAKLNEHCAKRAQPKTLHDSFLVDAEKWRKRAEALTDDVAATDVDEVIMWRVIEDVDARLETIVKEGL